MMRPILGGEYIEPRRNSTRKENSWLRRKEGADRAVPEETALAKRTYGAGCRGVRSPGTPGHGALMAVTQTFLS